MLSSKLKEKAADTVLDLHAAIRDIRDYREFPIVLESILKKIFHLDWLAMFSFGEGPNAYNIVTNPWLPFDWNEKYTDTSHFLTLHTAKTDMTTGYQEKRTS